MGKRFTGTELSKKYFSFRFEDKDRTRWDMLADEINKAIEAEEEKGWEPDWPNIMSCFVCVTRDTNGVIKLHTTKKVGINNLGVHESTGYVEANMPSQIWHRPTNPRDELTKRITEMSDDEALKLLEQLRGE